MKQFKCSMSKKIESLGKKSETDGNYVKEAELAFQATSDKIADYFYDGAYELDTEIKTMVYYDRNDIQYESTDNGVVAEVPMTFEAISSDIRKYASELASLAGAAIDDAVGEADRELIEYGQDLDSDYSFDDEINGEAWTLKVRFIWKHTTADESKKSEANLDDLKGMVVSEGTMRSEDLIPKFLNVLKTYAVDTYDDYVKENPEVLDLKGMDDETMGYVFDELFDKLDEIAPEGFYFAAHPDDGACYGFWEVDPNESKKPEACKGGKKYDKKDGKAAESKKFEASRDFIPKANNGRYDVHVFVYGKNGKLLHRDDYTAVTSTTYRQQVRQALDTYNQERDRVLTRSPEKADEWVEPFRIVIRTAPDGENTARVYDTKLHWLKDADWRKPMESVESKKSEGIGDHIKMNIDYNTFMRLLDAAAYLDADDDYKDALWDYYSEMGEIGGEAFVFFDNLFQYTSWYDVDEMYDEIGERFQDESKSKEECIQDAIDDGDMSIYKYKDHYLVLH